VEGVLEHPNEEFRALWEEEEQVIETRTENAAACTLTEDDFLTFIHNLRPFSEAQIEAELNQQLQPEGVEMAALTYIPQGYLPMIPTTIPDATAPGIMQHLLCGDVNLTYQQNVIAGDMLPLGNNEGERIRIREGQRAYLAEGGLRNPNAYGFHLVWDEAGYRHRMMVQTNEPLTAPRAAPCTLTREDVLAVVEGIAMPAPEGPFDVTPPPAAVTTIVEESAWAVESLTSAGGRTLFENAHLLGQQGQTQLPQGSP
jgi:hypothetical protein